MASFPYPSLETLLTRTHSRAYAGIGSRLTPAHVLPLMEGAAAMLGTRGLTLRSGGAPGADLAFEWGCHQVKGAKEIFLPWRRFNGSLSLHFMPPQEAFEIAALCHPNWAACSPVARRFHARNCQQILGVALDAPVSFVLYWAHEHQGIVRGGTATAITLARRLGIPVFNLRTPDCYAHWCRLAGEHLRLSRPAPGHPLSFGERITRDHTPPPEAP